MEDNFKEIHIGIFILKKVKEINIDDMRIQKFFNLSYDEISKMYSQESLDSDIILKWSKLLKYDFFRLYSQHLILYSPSSYKNEKKSQLPIFRKNIYTKEIIDFIIELIEKGNKSKNEVINEYGIPKTTLYKWLIKYKKINELPK